MNKLKLLSEVLTASDVGYLTEQKDGEKFYYIEGIFAQADVRNGNGRIYPRNIMEQQVNAYQSIIAGGTAYGELDHPTSATISMQNASHRMTDLRMMENGKDVYGKAVILPNRFGEIAISALKTGGRLAVSTRGVGSLMEGNVVGSNFKLITIDIVANPSAPNAFVNGILENLEYILEGDELKEFKLDTLNKSLANKGSSPVFGIVNQWLKTI